MGTPKTHHVFRFLLALTAAVALCLAAGSVSHASTAGAATVKTRHGKLGTFLVDSKGRTLYLFLKDKTSKSTCSDACAQNWPPLLTTGKPKASGSAKSSLLGTTKRADGKTQVTYNHHPVYLFINDKKAGDTKGQGINAFGAKWYVISSSGKKIGGY
jgi:predicted lipoprotein with Yx(FWY)xxD motif